jgi:hypothetical protein
MQRQQQTQLRMTVPSALVLTVALLVPQSVPLSATLKEARKYGAPKGMSITKRDMAADFKKYFADKPMTAKAAEKAKPQTFGAAFKEARARLGSGKTFTYNGKSFTTNIAGEGRKAPAAADKTPVKVPRNYNISPENRKAIDAAAKKTPFSKFDSKAFDDLKTGTNSYGAANIGKPAPAAVKVKAESGPSTRRGLKPNSIAGMVASGNIPNPFKGLRLTNDADMRAYYKQQYKERTEGKAKGGQITKKKPMPMGGKQLMPLKKKLTKEPITGGPDTVPATPERNEFRKEMMRRNATPGMKKGGKMKKYAAGGVTKEMPSSKAMGSLGMAKGGKAKMKPAAKGKAKSFAATKFGAAMMKKSADTKGRALPKFAKGGSIDGCAVRGKTKAKRVTMKRGGSC